MNLEQKLLSIGGKEMIGDENLKEDKLISEGEEVSNRNVVKRTMIHSSCHYNSAKLVIDHDESDLDGELQMWTGWGLTEDDQRWREHSWVVANGQTELFAFEGEDGVCESTVVSDGTIIETTVRRSKYYGYPVSRSEFDEIAFMHGAY